MEKENLIGDVIGIKELQNFQDIFCEAQKVFLTYYDKSGKRLTNISGRTDEKELLLEAIGEEIFDKAINDTQGKVRNGQKEICLDTEFENIKVMGIRNYVEQNYIGAWVLVIIYREKLYKDSDKCFPTENRFANVTFNGGKRAVKMLNIFSDWIISTAYENNQALEQLEEIKEKDTKITEELRKNSTIARISEYLKKDEDIEHIIDDIIMQIVEYLDLSFVSVVKVNMDNDYVESIGKYYSDTIFDEELGERILLDLYPLFECKNIYTIEPDTDNVVEQEILKKYGLKSLIAVPVMNVKKPEICAIFGESQYDRYWDINTVRFLFDVCKDVQSFIYKRISDNSLISSYAALKEILNNLGCGVFVMDKNDKSILFCNDVMIDMTGFDLVGEHCYDYFYGCKGKECSICRPQRDNSYFVEIYDEKRERWNEVRYNDITWVDGRNVSLCSINDITDKKKYQQRIEFQANNDYLTGLYNRMRCEEDLQLFVTEAEQTRMQGAVLFLDLDDFKHINDGLGHQYGDVLLKMIAVALQQIKGIENRCYRVGGDEFIVIIEPEQYNKYDYIVDEIKKMFSSPWYLGNNEYYCTMSMGIVTFPKNGRDVNDLIKKADIAMYDAKKNGKNAICLYSEGEDTNSYIKLDIEKNMRASVASGCEEFEIYIQPVMEAETEKCIGGEALVRWNSKKLGFLMPGDFIPLAEHMGLIISIGEHVLRCACKLLKKWNTMGIDVKLNVNLSVIQLLANNIVDVIKNVVEEYQINTEKLVLEVTESLAINDMTRMKKIIKEIKSLGIKIALDDFGIGYSSLNYIKQMDLDIIKVDRTFIKDICDDEYAKAFVKLISELSQKLEVQVCVEGVEEQNQIDILKQMNISMIQGFFYGKPMPVKEFEKKFLGISDGE